MRDNFYLSAIRDFESIIDEYGYDVLVVRKEKKLRCSCWNEKRQEARRDCPVCFGLGWVPVIERHKVRDVDTSIPETLAQSIRDSRPGRISIFGRAYFFRNNIKLRKGDLIVDVEFDERGKPIYTGRGMFEISHIDPARFKKGQIVFNKVFCKDQPIQKEVRAINIIKKKGIVNYELIVDEGWIHELTSNKIQ